MVERFPSRWIVLVASVATAGCASVLGVDQNYVLGDERNDGGVPESAPPPPLARIRCGSLSCDPASEECCLASDNSLSCTGIHGNAVCRTGVSIRCDNGAACGGQVCCINLDAVSTLLGTSCQTSCPAASAGSQWLELCDPDASTCVSGLCSAVAPLAPSPPLGPGWFYACQ
jgi:hypothetical protein